MSAKLQAKFSEAHALHLRGKVNDAVSRYQAILKQDPCHIPALYMLGVAAFGRKEFKRAANHFRQVLELEPHDPDAHFELANCLYQLNQTDAAIDSMKRAIKLNPANADFYCNLGIFLRKQKRSADALDCYQQALKLNPQDPDIWFNRGNVLRDLNLDSDAVDSYRQTLARNPHHPAAWNNLGQALRRLGQFEEAEKAFEQALETASTSPDCLYDQGLALYNLRRHVEALACLEQVQKQQPERLEASFDISHVLVDMGRADEALAKLEQRLKETPDHPDVHFHIGKVLMGMGRYPQALAEFTHIRTRSPDHAAACFYASALHLLQGDFSAGWPEYESRKKMVPESHHPQLDQPLWLGAENLCGKTILLYAEQGMGDTLQFCRYALLLAEQGAQVILEVQPALRSLLSTLPGNIQLIAAGDPRPAFDYYCPLMSLPLACKTAATSIPATTPYLSCDAGKKAVWDARLGPKTRPRIGLAWSGSPSHQNDHLRSIALTQLIPLINSISADWVALQKDIRPVDAAILAECQIACWNEELHDFSDTAALAACMDLIISVDTSLVHLAGALDLPVWVMLPFTPDWRWQLERDDSPWYPSVRLFRQNTSGNWQHVVQQLTHTLKAAF